MKIDKKTVSKAAVAKQTTEDAAGEDSRQRRQRVQAAETCLVVLKALTDLGGRASLTAIGQAVQESPAKVHRYLASLMAQGLVEQERGSTQYALGPEAIRVGLAAMRQVDPIRAAEPALIHLRESLQVTSFVAVMGNKGPVIVRFEEPSLPVTVNVRVGSVMSLLWSATGRAFLAFMEPSESIQGLVHSELLEARSDRREQVEELERPGAVDRLLSTVKEVGCASVRDVNLPGISAVAAPIFDFSGHVVGVLCALGASGGFDPAPQGPIARAVREQARAVSASLGQQQASPAQAQT